jgi:hypothetical protein
MSDIRNENDIIRIIENDPWMMRIIKTVQTLGLPDCWVCAGFVRSKVWDVLHGFADRVPLDDVDVVYFDPNNPSSDREKQLEEQLRNVLQDIPWSVKNQARMHLRNGDEPYTSSTDAISKFPETVTAIGVRLDDENKLCFTSPCGIEDLINLKVRPTPYFLNNSDTKLGKYLDRLAKKKWHLRWYKIKYEVEGKG